MRITEQEAQRLGPESIFAQLAAHGLLPELRADAVIDLSNPAPDDHRLPLRVKRRRTRWPRGAAVLRGTATENGRQVAVWCPFEYREHYHGRHGACEPGTCGCLLHLEYTIRGACTCPVGSGDGHRAAHCRPGSPLRATGYYVQEIWS